MFVSTYSCTNYKHRQAFEPFPFFGPLLSSSLLELWLSRLPLDSYISPQLLFICHHHHHIRRNRFMLPATHNCTWDRCNKSVCETTTTTSPHHHKREINSLLVSIQNPITYVPRGGCCLHTRLCKLPGCV